MQAHVHIVYPEAGIAFSQLKKIFAAFEDGCKAFFDSDVELEEGKVLRVESGSIWLEVILPIAQAVLPYFANFIKNKLCNKRNKVEICVGINEGIEIIKITIED